MIALGVNIDHVATIRQARKTFEPDPVWAAAAAQMGGADGITVHLREDRRHIQDRDLEVLRQTVTVKLNLECACCDEMLEIACRTKPEQVCLVPEHREEVTTEGGLDVRAYRDVVVDAIARLHDNDIAVSLFVDPDPAQIELSAELNADRVEIHTGMYAEASGENRKQQFARLQAAAKQVAETPMEFDAGHGLTYHNVVPVSQLFELKELNIGHSIVSRSIMVGMEKAVREMKKLVNDYSLDRNNAAQLPV